MIGSDIPYTHDHERTALGLALAALEAHSERWADLVEGTPDPVTLIAALSDWAATLAHDFAAVQGRNGEEFLREAMLNCGNF